jgi:hypothetical protein
MSQVNREPFDENNEGIRSNECSKWILETTTTSFGTIGEGNAQGNEDHSMNALLEVP